MANTSECTHPFKKLNLSDPSCAMAASMDSEYVTPLASESEHATTSSALFFAACTESMSSERKESGEWMSVKDRIERSKLHWSQLTEFSDSDCDEDEVAEERNVEVLKTLQLHLQWGDFFGTFGYQLRRISYGELEVGEKFAEGGQVEFYEAHVKWHNLK